MGAQTPTASTLSDNSTGSSGTLYESQGPCWKSISASLICVTPQASFINLSRPLLPQI